MLHDAVDHGGGHLVVAEHGAPAAELEVGRDHHRLPLVGLRDHLEQQPRPVGVQRREAELVEHQQPRPTQLLELPVEPALVAGAPQAHDEGGGGEEARGLPGLAGERAQRRGHVRLAGAHVAHRDQVLAGAEERQRQQPLPAEALRPARARPVAAVEGLGRRQRAAPEERGPLGRVPAGRLRLREAGEVLDLPGRAGPRPPLQDRRGERAPPAGAQDPPPEVVASGHPRSPPLPGTRRTPRGRGIPWPAAARRRRASRARRPRRVRHAPRPEHEGGGLAGRVEAGGLGGPRDRPQRLPALGLAAPVERLDERGGHVAPYRRLAEGPRPGDERRHERQRVAHGLAGAPRARELGDPPAAVGEHLDRVGPQADEQVPGVPGRPGAAPVAGDLDVAALVRARPHPTHGVEGDAGQRQHGGEVLAQRLGRRRPGAAPRRGVDAVAAVPQRAVGRRQGRGGRLRDQEVAAQEAHRVLDRPLSLPE